MAPATFLPPTLPAHVAESFAAILRSIHALIWNGYQRHPAFHPIFIPICNFITSRIRRFERALARRPGPARPARPRAARPNPDGRAPAPCARVALPRAHAWLVRMIGYKAAGFASQLEHLLAQPGVPELIRSRPAAARILRPLCHLLGIKPPCIQRAPKPKPEPAPRPARPPRAPRPELPLHSPLRRRPSCNWPRAVMKIF